MNRHFASYYPLPIILGTPIRPEPEPAKEVPWRPASTPGYEVRTVNGKSELRPTVLVPEPKKVAATVPLDVLAGSSAAVPAGATHVQVLNSYGKPADQGYHYRPGPFVNAEFKRGDSEWIRSGWLNTDLAGPHFKALPAAEAPAPTEWQTQAPPEKGWREVLPFGNCGYKAGSYAYWFGDGWSMFGPPDDKGRDGDVSRPPAHALSLLQWRGPRLTGPAWPEPAQ